jgi:lipoprotein-releasing system ATP-binding protein
MIVLKAKGLKKSFYNPHQIQILKNVDLDVNKGETIAIIGRSGQGKSTLLQILGTLDNPDEGTIEICGQPITRFNVSRIRNEKIAFIFQSFHLLEDYTALENILMPARIGRSNVDEVHAMKLLEYVGLKERAHFSAKLLSGGEKQRVAIARALCNNPDIIFADEPSGNLDKETADHIHQLLLSYAKEHGKTLIFVTHDRDLARLCDKTYILEAGDLTTS